MIRKAIGFDKNRKKYFIDKITTAYIYMYDSYKVSYNKIETMDETALVLSIKEKHWTWAII